MTLTTVPNLRDESYSYFAAAYPDFDMDNRHNNEVDAFRHAYASAVLTYELSDLLGSDVNGSAAADSLGWAHEQVDNFNGQPADEYDMDSYNNEQGRIIGASIAADDPNYKDDIAEAVAAALDNGQLKIISPAFATSASGDYTAEQSADDKAVAQANEDILSSYYSYWGGSRSWAVTRTLGPALPIFESLMSQSEKDPLVLDLTGDGVSLTTTDGSSEYFDISGSDVSNLTAWATGGDGILVTDPDNTGVISSVSQLIGGDTGNGFASLSTFDSNGDGQITSADTNWSELRVFVPAWDSNAGGLYTLSALGITSISLNAINTSYQISGNNITQSSTFTMGGDSYAIDDVWLNYSTVNTVYTGSYTLDPDVLFLPEVRGYGDLPDLSIAMSLDGTLKSEVADVANDNWVQCMKLVG